MLAFNFSDLNNGDVKSSAPQVIDDDFYVASLVVHTVRERRGGRFVNDAFDVQSRDLSGVLCGLTLSVVEIGRYGDHCIGYRFA